MLRTAFIKAYLKSMQKWGLTLLVAWVILFVSSCQYQLPDHPSQPSKLPENPISHLPTQPPIQSGLEDNSFESITPIWSADSNPADNNEIVLFRHKFTNLGTAPDTKLQLFADTRYEVWFDDEWIDRGPARFSKTIHEYDKYELGDLSAGEHLIAILVQWAPNFRRSESTIPHLQARILSTSLNSIEFVTTSNEQWKSIRSDAWRSDSIPVHTWGLIGPTELVDFRRLPIGWNQMDYTDEEWPAAISIDLNTEKDIHYQPRSIPKLVNTLIPITIIKSGAISPDFKVGELTPDIQPPHDFTVSASEATSIIMDILVTAQDGITETQVVSVDGVKPNWYPVGPERPDVFQTIIPVDKGTHTVSFSKSPTYGITFDIYDKYLEIQGLPFGQGTHAGRRMLLSQLSQNSDQIYIDKSDDKLNIEFTSPPSYVILDLGRTVHGRLTADVFGETGSLIDIGWDERIYQDINRPLPFPGSMHPEWNQVDSWILDGNKRSLNTIDTRSGRYILIAVWGNNRIKLENIHVEEEHYPVTQVGSFHSADPLLDQIWQVGVDSLIPNMLDAYVDTSWRERGQWWGDTYVAHNTNKIAFGDSQLIQRGIMFMANTMQSEPAPGLAPNNRGHHMLDYSMLWVHALAETIQTTPEQQANSLAEKYYETLLSFMAHLQAMENSETHLIDLPERHWSANAYIDTFGWHSRDGQPTALNALYYGTILQAAYISDYIGDPSQAAQFRQKAGLVKQSINRLLFLPNEHRYTSAILGGEAIEPSPHAQAWSLVYGLVPEDEIPYVTDTLLELLSIDPTSPNINVYGMYWVLEALGKSGRIDDGIDVIRQYYNYMLEQGASTWWEAFLIYPRPSQSLSHSWGGAPTMFLTKYVLGASQTSANHWTVEPYFDSMSVAEGTLPLWDSLLHVHWENKVCGESILSISSGHHTSGQVKLPLDQAELIDLNDTVIFQGTELLSNQATIDAKHIIIELGEGQHQLSIIRECTHP